MDEYTVYRITTTLWVLAVIMFLVACGAGATYMF